MLKTIYNKTGQSSGLFSLLFYRSRWLNNGLFGIGLLMLDEEVNSNECVHDG